MKVISRQYYAEKIDSWLGKEQIIVLVGQRRVGKSYLMKDFIARHENEPDANIIYIDKEKRSFRFVQTCEELDTYIDAHIISDKHNYILIDEVQDIIGWEKSVRSYRTEDNVDMLITGSNSKMLSGELGTLLGGRYEQILIQSLTYSEFLLFHHLEDSDDSLWKYLNYGGLCSVSFLHCSFSNAFRFSICKANAIHFILISVGHTTPTACSFSTAENPTPINACFLQKSKSRPQSLSLIATDNDFLFPIAT